MAFCAWRKRDSNPTFQYRSKRSAKTPPNDWSTYTSTQRWSRTRQCECALIERTRKIRPALSKLSAAAAAEGHQHETNSGKTEQSSRGRLWH